ncbi:tripartite tricarboxylate transporter TctB family protein [Uliginosibacterium sp. H3]|uniref:Tripartite tricarboxylate transporter TctB family protein n=1 Tax=Uliginosibacterium silvisoli TaxID=3114758 RepID=A0ABU6K4L0_9RHOO|nr:tripartite tricarboxylate transporter TctB family protein [Uliginosibacterium sp. H3]
MKQADLISGGVGSLIGIYAIWEAQRMPADVIMKIGPGFFPTILASMLLIFSLLLMLNALRGKSKGEVPPLRWSDPAVRRGLCLLVATAVFCLALKPIGFIPCAIVFLFLMMLVLGNRKPRALLMAPLIVTGGIWLTFEKLLHLELPSGILAPLLG